MHFWRKASISQVYPPPPPTDLNILENIELRFSFWKYVNMRLGFLMPRLRRKYLYQQNCVFIYVKKCFQLREGDNKKTYVVGQEGDETQEYMQAIFYNVV